MRSCRRQDRASLAFFSTTRSSRSSSPTSPPTASNSVNHQTLLTPLPGLSPSLHLAPPHHLHAPCSSRSRAYSTVTMPRLKVTIGPHRYDMAIAHVNQPAKPTEINTDKFVGRVSVFVKDFAGVTPDGSPPTRDAAIFNGRSRKFIILIEGRWKQRPGVAPYTGDEIQFGESARFASVYPAVELTWVAFEQDPTLTSYLPHSHMVHSMQACA